MAITSDLGGLLKRLAFIAAAGLSLALAGCAAQASEPVPSSVQKYYDENVKDKKASLPKQEVLPTAVFIGDSYTAGAGTTSQGAGWAHVAARTLAWFPYISADPASGFITEGKKGLTMSELVASSKPEIAPKYVVIASGYNDSASDPEALTSAINADLDAAKAKWKAAKFVVVGPWAPNGTVNENQSTTRDLLKTAAAERKMGFIDPISQGWFKTPGMIGDDNIHPTDTGHRIIGEEAADAIKAALKL